MKSRAYSIKKGIADLLELPRDIMLGLPKVTLIGNLQLYIENHGGVIEYCTDLVRVKTKTGVLTVTGEDLVIRSIRPEEIVIAGRVDGIELVQ